MYGDSNKKRKAKNHMFATFHKFLVYDFASKVFACFDMDGFLYDGIRATSKGLPSSILFDTNEIWMEFRAKKK